MLTDSAIGDMLDKFFILDLEEKYSGRWKCVGQVICYTRKISNTAVHKIMKIAWEERYKGVRITDLSQDVVMFDFTNEKDYKDAMDFSPWAIQGHCLSLKHWTHEMRLQDVQFKAVQFWVQVHGLQLGMLSHAGNANKIGNYLGRLIETEQREGPNGKQRAFLRIKVEVDSDTPLFAGFWYRRTNGDEEEAWASLKYERLTGFCYRCGMLGHIDTHCKKDVTRSVTNPEEPMYGPWMSTLRPKYWEGSSFFVGRRENDPVKSQAQRTWEDMMRNRETNRMPAQKGPARINKMLVDEEENTADPRTTQPPHTRVTAITLMDID